MKEIAQLARRSILRQAAYQQTDNCCRYEPLAEPLLASLAGGGFLTARTGEGDLRVFDFFAQTPHQHQSEAELLPIDGDFGGTTQEFHIGMGATATPGVVDGLWSIHDKLGRMPITGLAGPAIDAAKAGIVVNDFQAYIAQILRPIITFQATIDARYSVQHGADTQLLGGGDTQYFPDFADTLEALSHEGCDLFYRGEIAARIEQLSLDHGGHLTRNDLAAYKTTVRSPLTADFAGTQLHTNPVPSCGGTLIAHSLALLTRLEPDPGNEVELAEALASVMAATNLVRGQSGLQLDPGPDNVKRLLGAHALDSILDQLRKRPLVTRGTTQISVADSAGNVASMTLSNGEGNGYLIPGTDIHLNNFLGEQDLNPAGIGEWSSNLRMSSMMAPTLVEDHQQQRWLALGSGGSNRLRTAILQVLVNHLQRDDGLSAAIERPRLHLEENKLSIEPGFSSATIERLAALPCELEPWDSNNVFFGGVHAVEVGPAGFDGHGDSRRGGAVAVAGS